MKDKKKGFWILLLFFSLLAVVVLSVNQVTIEAGMEDMGLSMGGMMKKHHIVNLNAVELLRSSFEPHGMDSMNGHHTLGELMNSLSFFTTIIVYLALPLLLGGTTLLLVLWY